MRNLSKQQEDFLQNLMRGMSQRQAYIAAFPRSKKWKPESVDAEACNMLKKPNVAIRYEELKLQAQEANEITRDAILTHLKNIAFWPVDYKKLRPADQLRALELMARITGLDSPEY